MSYTLSAIKQIRFPVEDSPFGWYQVIINRPGFPDVDQPDADTLLLSRVTDAVNGDYSPYLESDVQLSKKRTTTKGRRALDDVTLAIRDSYGYSGTVNGVDTAELFSSDYLTFLDVWFNDVLPYKGFIAWKDAKTNLVEVSHEGYIDPLYKPSADPEITNPGTPTQIWRGTRTIKITALAQKETWQDVLNLIHEADCVVGPAYAGFVATPPGCDGKSNTRQDPFSTNLGSIYQAIPHIHLNDPSADPILVGTTLFPTWPATPWTSTHQAGQIAIVHPNFSHLTSGDNYVVGDRGTISGGGVLAEYEVTIIAATPGGHPEAIKLIDAGSGYTVGTDIATTTTTGVGTGMTVDIVKVSNGALWGPNGTVFINVGVLFQKIAVALGLGAFTLPGDLVSALDFFAQKADNVALNFPIDPTPLVLADLYVSLNLFAKSHPADGSYWDNPIGFSPDALIVDVLTGLCDFLLTDYNVEGGDLKLKEFGASGSALPAGWEVINSPTREEPSTGPRVVTVKNKADDLAIVCPLGVVGDSLNLEILLRLHRIGNTSGNINSGVDQVCMTFDSKKKSEEQADECFKVAWMDGSGNMQLNSECWKGLCFLYWYHLGATNVVYPSNWSPMPTVDGGTASWGGSFYAVNALYKKGSVPPVDLCAAINGKDFFNSIDYHAVANAAINLPLDSVLSYEYAGLSDSSGSVRAIGTNIIGQWRDGFVPDQNWSGSELVQMLKAGITQIKWSAQASGGSFPELVTPGLPYGPTSSGNSTGTSSTTGTVDSGGSNGSTVGALLEHPGNSATNTVTIGADGIIHLTLQGIAGQTSDFIKVLNSSATAIFELSAAGIMTATGARLGYLDMLSQLVQHVADPVSSDDAATKNYVDGIAQTPTAYTGTQDDLVLGIGNVFRITATAALSITGIATHGRFVLINVGTFPITLANANAGSLAANRFLFSGDVILDANGTVELFYDAASSRWRLLSNGG